MRKLRDNDANDLDRLRATVAQTLCNDIPKEMMFFCKGLDSLAFLLMRGLSFSARDTVATETPSSRAISFIVIGEVSFMVGN